ncbi:MAG: hypothetical protein EXR58_08780 [Chloroflexi bacterium]|nr:hypothetical protein [Chloroflexota bacterium]
MDAEETADIVVIGFEAAGAAAAVGSTPLTCAISGNTVSGSDLAVPQGTGLTRSDCRWSLV